MLQTWSGGVYNCANRSITHFPTRCKTGPTLEGLGSVLHALAWSHLSRAGHKLFSAHRTRSAQSRFDAPRRAKSNLRISGTLQLQKFCITEERLLSLVPIPSLSLGSAFLGMTPNRLPTLSFEFRSGRWPYAELYLYAGARAAVGRQPAVVTGFH